MDINIGGLGNISAASTMRQTADIGRDEARVNSFQAELESALSSDDSSRLKEAARSFEAHFINMMFKQMRATINHSEGGLFERSSTEKLFQELLDEQFSEIAADAGSFGLARQIYEQIRRNG